MCCGFRKIARSQERLNKEIPVNIKEHEERISEIASEIKVLVKEAEVAGDEGDVDKAKSIMDQVGHFLEIFTHTTPEMKAKVKLKAVFTYSHRRVIILTAVASTACANLFSLGNFPP